MIFGIYSLLYKLTRRIALFLCSIQGKGHCLFLWIPGIFIKRLSRLEYRKLIWLDEAANNKRRIFHQKSSFKSYGPQTTSDNQLIVESVAPEIALFKFKNAFVVATSSHVVTKEFAYIERLPEINAEIADYSTGLIFEHSSTHAVVRGGSDCELTRGVFLGGNGSWNYYHWMIEILPKLKYFIEAGVFTHDSVLMVNEKAKDIPNFHTMLVKALENVEVRIFYMKPSLKYKVGTLFHLSTPSNIVFNVRNKKFLPHYNYLNQDSINYIKSLAFSLLNDPTSESNELPKNIFLARKGAIRSYNQDEILEVLKEYGFVEVYLEECSIQKQAQLFRAAEKIVGPTGAGWTNLIFSRPHTKCLCWMAEELGDFSAFSNIAFYSQVNLYYITYKSQSTNLYRSEYHLSKMHLEEAIKRTL